MTVLWIALAGGLGATLRYLITIKMNNDKEQYYATFLINIVGSFLIGLAFAVNSSFTAAVISIGFLGGFTTYSTFMYETLLLIQKGELRKALIYNLLSFVIGIAFVFAGSIVGQTFIN
jgi:fluoride exporter